MVTLLVCLLGFAGVSVACDKHKKDQANISESAKTNAESSENEAVADEFRVSDETPAGPSAKPSQVKTVSTEAENNNSHNIPSHVANADVQVIEFVLANKVEGRQPSEIVENFSKENGKGFAFAQLSASKHTQVTFVWIREGKEHSRFTTNVHASKKWRTYSSTKLRPGNWKVQLLAGDQILAERTFTVQ
jgi:hypothetical protein